ncbi:MAG TPA: CehA/McbA family metallohydrolase, partial [Blastocatellia bacterium]|nr:CehA/McbA family metallohydrolase [Blastocatellia bacterium]
IRLDISYEYTHRGEGVTIDIGLFDPVGFRGWSGSNKSSFFISREAASPSYRAGELPPGRWRILLGVAHVREGLTSHYTVRIRTTTGRVERTDEMSAIPGVVLKKGPGWYRGDLHAHTGHSDGFCRNEGKQLVPCPVFRVAEAARARGLDFLAITDHNTTSHHAELASLQGYFTTLLLIRGQELTTYRGHANLYGTSEFVDFRLGMDGRTVNDLLDEAHRAGGLISINHPSFPTGEMCRGCGWQDTATTDFSRVDMVEVINGTRVEGPLSGIPFWQDRLNEGYRITAIGGGDDHRAGSGEQPENVMGVPTTVVFARELSEAAILAGLKAGHAYIRTRGPDGPHVELTAEDQQGRRFLMGDEMVVRPDETITLTIWVKDGGGQKIEIVKNGQMDGAAVPVTSSDFRTTVRIFASDRAWYRVTLRDDRGITAITNPIYIRLSKTTSARRESVLRDAAQTFRPATVSSLESMRRFLHNHRTQAFPSDVAPWRKRLFCTLEDTYGKVNIERWRPTGSAVDIHPLDPVAAGVRIPCASE